MWDMYICGCWKFILYIENFNQPTLPRMGGFVIRMSCDPIRQPHNCVVSKVYIFCEVVQIP